MIFNYSHSTQNSPAPKLTGLAYISRWFGVMFCYAAFGIGGLLLSLTALPLLRVLPGTKNQRIARVQKTVQLTFKFFVLMLTWAGVVKVTSSAAKTLSSTHGKIIVANHPTIVDVVVLISLIPNAGCIVKRGLWRNPFLRGVVSMAGYIPNNSGTELLKASTEVLSRGNNLVIFPEGTRTALGIHLNPLARGAAQIAIKSEADVLPMVLHTDVRGFTKEEAWYEAPRQTINMHVEGGEVLPYKTYDSKHEQDPKQVRQLTRDMELYFKQQLEN